MSVKINFVSDIFEGATTKNGEKWIGGETPYNRSLPVGASQWQNGTDGNIAGLAFVCPCGCGSIGTTAVVKGFGTKWNWDGNKEFPTLTPSIQKLTACKWHGYLTKGEFVPC